MVVNDAQSFSTFQLCNVKSERDIENVERYFLACAILYNFVFFLSKVKKNAKIETTMFVVLKLQTHTQIDSRHFGFCFANKRHQQIQFAGNISISER